jgi:hypothetical protein
MVLLVTLDFMASNDRMVSVCRVEKDEEGSIGGQVWGTVLLSVWRDRTSMKYVRIHSVPAEIRTGNLSVTIQNHLFGGWLSMFLFPCNHTDFMLMGCPSMAVWFLPLAFCVWQQAGLLSPLYTLFRHDGEVLHICWFLLNLINTVGMLMVSQS